VTAPTEDVLRQATLFRRLLPEDRARVAAISQVHTYNRGELVFAEGDRSDYFVTIVSGRVKVYKSTPSGKEIILEIFSTGDPLGAVAAYYALISIFAVGFRLMGASHAATTWGAVALIAGPVFGAAGGAWRHWEGNRRAFAVGLLAASLIAEGIVFGKLGTGDAVGIFYLVEIAIGVVVPLLLLRPRERLPGYAATLLLAVAIGVAIGPVTVLVRSLADRF